MLLVLRNFGHGKGLVEDVCGSERGGVLIHELFEDGYVTCGFLKGYGHSHLGTYRLDIQRSNSQYENPLDVVISRLCQTRVPMLLNS